MTITAGQAGLTLPPPLIPTPLSRLLEGFYSSSSSTTEVVQERGEVMLHEEERTPLPLGFGGGSCNTHQDNACPSIAATALQRCGEDAEEA